MSVLLTTVGVRWYLHSVALTPILSTFFFPPSPVHTLTLLRNPQPEPSHTRKAHSASVHWAAQRQGTHTGHHLPGIAIVTSKDPQLVTVHRGTMG